MSPKVVDKEKKKRQIVLAAMKVFSEKGVKSSRMADIAVGAGIGKGTIYEYFKNRDEILAQAFYLILNEMEGNLNSALKDIDNPEDKIVLIFRAVFETMSQYPDDFMMLFVEFWSEGMRHRGEDDKRFLNLDTFYREFRRELAAILDDGIEAGRFAPMNTNAVASVMIAILDGLLLQVILDRKAFDHRDVIEESLRMILNGIKAKRASSQEGL
jgi:AcrR family transcriptional regulator